MKKTFALALLASATLAACSKAPEAPVAQAPVETPAVAVASEKASLMGGYVPQFDYRIRSQRHESGKHVVIVEFLGQDAAAVGAKLQEELIARRLTVKGPTERADGVVRYQAQNSKVGVMLADISGSPKLKLGPDANGTIYFSWQDI